MNSQSNSPVSSKASSFTSEEVKESQIPETKPSADLQVIDIFYNDCLEGSNVIQSDVMLKQLMTIEGFDQEEFSKDFKDIDFEKVAQSVKNSIQGEWGVPKGKQGAKTGIQKLLLQKGSVLEMGSSSKQKFLLVKGLKSKWIQHGFSFGDNTKRQYTVKELLSQREQFEYADFKKLTQLDAVFELNTDTKDLQSKECLDQMKLVELIRHLMGSQVKESIQQDYKDPKTQYIVTGFTKKSFDEKYYKEELTKVIFPIQIVPLAGKSTDILRIKNPQEINKDVICEFPVEENKTIDDIIKMLQLQSMDIVLSIDSAAVKKDGRNVQIMPKIRIEQIVLNGINAGKQLSTGLNFNKSFAKKNE